MASRRTRSLTASPAIGVVQKCPHNDVYAIGMQRDGKVATWDLHGPLNEHEMDVMLARTLEAFKGSNRVIRWRKLQ